MAKWNFDPRTWRKAPAAPAARTSDSYRKERAWRIEQFEQRMLLAISPSLIAIVPNDGEVLLAGQTRDTAPRELTIRFTEGQAVDPTSLGGIQLVRSGGDGVFGNANDQAVTPGYVGIGNNPNEVIVRFAETLPDDFYQLTLVGQGADAIKNTTGDAFNNGTNVVTPFRLDLGAQVLAVVPQPITRNAQGVLQQANDKVVVYFNEGLDPAAAQNVNLYQLIFTNGTASNADDVIYKPTVATYDNAARTVTLTFAGNIDALGSGAGTYRLRIGDDSPQSPAPSLVDVGSDAGSSLGTATNLGPLNGQSKVLNGGAISNGQSPTNTPYGLTLPGGVDNPGHRDIPAESHLNGGGDANPGITVIYYNFRLDYGSDPQGNPLENVINEEQKQRAREVFEIYGKYLGVQFVESPSQGFTIATGDLRVLAPSIPTGPGGVAGIAGGSLAIMDAAEDWGNSEFGGGWFNVAMHEIGHLLGLGHTYDLPALTVQGSEGEATVEPAEPVFPGDADILHGQYLYRPDSKDVDFYRFQLTTSGQLNVETIAERLSTSSLLDTVISLYNADGQLVARNDDYFSSDSFLDLHLEAGTYYIGVSSTGNTQFNPNIIDSGFGGTTEGAYQLRLNFEPTPSGSLLVDSTQTPIDGDFDGESGGEYNFWFNVGSNTIYVDKSAAAGLANGTLARPYNNIAVALAAAAPGTVVRIVGNGGADGNVNTLGDNRAYEIGLNEFNQPLSDGATMDVPQGVTVVIDAGAVFKVRHANINVGSYAQGIDLGKGALQVLGTPNQRVTFTSYNNEAVGVDTNPLSTSPQTGDWGGLVFRGGATDLAGDQENAGIFVNYVGNANIDYGGGTVVVDSKQDVYNPIHMITARPTVAFNRITNSADAAISADPDSFAETLFRDDSSTAEYRRIGPEVHGNTLLANSINGLFVRIRTESGVPIDVMNVQGRFNDTDIVHVISENLLVKGTPGGPLDTGSGPQARLDARLAIDPGVIVKLKGSRIEVGMGAQLIAEGTASDPVVFTSQSDDRYGAGGTFDTTGDAGSTSPEAGDWGGIYFHPVSKGSIDHSLITFAGGSAPIEGEFTNFNAVEIRQAEVRIANSVLEVNADGLGSGDRNGRGYNTAATVFVRGAQPVLLNNVFRANAGDAISINANALSTRALGDYGRSTGAVDRFTQFDDNQGALVRLNRLVDNDINGMVVRGATLTTESVWDDTDIVHVLREAIEVPNLHTVGGLRLESSPTQSLVVKLEGENAGFTAGGRPLDIDDRIGGSLYVLGTPGHAVILTALSDETVGAGFDLQGLPQTKTRKGDSETPLPGAWSGVKLEQYSNDRNVDNVGEIESSYTGPLDVNSTPSNAQYLGTLAPDKMNGDDNRRLGFEIHGAISYDRPGDVDVYSFNGTAGAEVWIDIDRTSVSLDTVVELIDANGNVLARSNDSTAETANPGLLIGIGRTLQRGEFSTYDLFTTNPRDAGMRLILPGTAGTSNTYYVRVRSNSPNLTNLAGGQTRGDYRMQIRLQEVDEFPGSTVRFADIRYATNGITVEGLPAHSPQTGDYASGPAISNTTLDQAQDVGNLLAADRNTIAIASAMLNPLDVDWFKFTLDYQDIQAIGGYSDSGKTWATIFDIDYADGMSRPNLTLSVFDSLGNLIFVSRDSNIADDQPSPDPLSGSSGPETLRGTFGKKDPFLGTVQMPEGGSRTYYVAVSTNATLPGQLVATFTGDKSQRLVRMEPVNSVKRIVEDHIGAVGYKSGPNGGVTDVAPTTGAILPIETVQQLQANVMPFTLGDMTLFISQNDGSSYSQLRAVNPFTGELISSNGLLRVGDEATVGWTTQDLAMRSDGLLYGTQRNPLADSDDMAGRLIVYNPANGQGYLVGADNISSQPIDENGVPDPEASPDEITSFQSDAVAFRRFPTGLSWVGAVDHYDMYYAVTNALTGRSHLFRGNPSTGDATLGDDPFGPVNAIGFDDPPFSLNTEIYALIPGDIGRVTGMAYLQRRGLVMFGIGPSQITDGQIFSISDSNRTVIFEFDKLGNGVAADRVAVNVVGATNTADVTNAILGAISAAGLNITAEPSSSFFSATSLIGAFGANGFNSAVQFDGLPGYGQTLFGVDNQGQFFRLSDGYASFSSAGIASSVVQLNPTTPFAGLAAAPQNLDINGDGVIGDLRDTFFAICENGDLYAIDANTGTFRTDIFPNGATYISTFLQGATGLAFSNLDFNLWHPTNFGAKEAGHGINLAPDNSRTPDSDDADDAGVASLGNTSYYFGFEAFSTDRANAYLTYAQNGIYGVRNESTQYGVQSQEQQDDLTYYARFNFVDAANTPPVLLANPELQEAISVHNNYNFAGGARGTLITNPFSLVGYDYTDKPTLYFNYLLEGGIDLNVLANSDLAAVSISKDNGLTWELIATNNPLAWPEFLSASSDASGAANQIVQPLHNTIADVTTGILDTDWRQARIDIGKYAGESNIQLRFDFRSSRADNNYRGFAIDDIIVGMTERGEMVTRSPGLEGLPVLPVTAFFPVPQNPTPGSTTEVLVGAYQLEIRRGTEYGFSASGLNSNIIINPGSLIDTNDRLGRGFTINTPAGSAIADGQTFVISDGVNRITYEFNSSGGVQAGNVPVNYLTSDTAAQVAKKIVTAINGNNGPNLKVSASSIATSLKVEVFGAASVTSAGTPAMTIRRSTSLGDNNLLREQGQVLIQASQVSNSLVYGIVIDANQAWAPRNLMSVNSTGVVTGVTVTNNLVTNSGVGGIFIDGSDQGTGIPPAIVPFARVINNTIFGGGAGIGIQVGHFAAPTLINNIVSSLQVGIGIDPTSSTRTIIGGTLYHANLIKSLGVVAANESFGIDLIDGDPLFVNAAAGNFNLLAGSKAIDSAINSLQDRQQMITINNPIGIGLSPILAPLTDLTGKLRIDDPSALPPPGLGSNVFKDRGALDRSDFTGPSAVLVNPQDNDTAGADQDPTPNRVIPVGTVQRNFQLQLVDGTGVGIDPLSVDSSKFVLKRDGVTLVEGTDYVFGYDKTNHIVRFTPVEGIWLTGSTYVITLDNSVATGIRDLGNNVLRPNELSGVTVFTISLVPLDFGDAPDPEYATLLESNGARHVIVPDMYLGSGVTEDVDGNPNSDATGDVDDGVVFNTPLVPGLESTITVTASKAGFIDAFIDLNGDGDWEDAGEKILNQVPVVAGANVLTVTLPAATATQTFARFRYSSTGGLSSTGIATDGEVEDYAVTIPASVAYTVRLYNTGTGQEVFKDAQGRYVVLANSQIEARVYVDDVRAAGATGGVFAAFADLVASQPYLEWDASSLTVDPAFAVGVSGSTDPVFGIDEAGGVGNASPPGANPRQLLFSVKASVLGAAAPGATFSLTVGAADQLPAHNSLVYGLNGAVAATYQTVELVVPLRAWQNPYQPLDVFPDGYISGLDALLIINEINKPGGGLTPLDPTPVAPNAPPPYLDVDGDGFVTATDALLVINELNNPTLAQPFIIFGEDLAAAPASTPAASAPVASAPVDMARLLGEGEIVMAVTPSARAAAPVAAPQLTDLALSLLDKFDDSVAAFDDVQLPVVEVDAVALAVGNLARSAAAAAPRLAERVAERLELGPDRLADLARLFADHAADDDVAAWETEAKSVGRELVNSIVRRRRS